MDREKVFDALRNCITEQKCRNCPWEECGEFNCKKTDIPVHLGLDILEVLKEQLEIVRCKDCKHQNWVNAETGCIVCKVGRGTNAPDWFCADGERK